MIKRPFLWVLESFLSGMLLAWLRAPVSVPIQLLALSLISLYFLLYHSKKAVQFRKEYVLYSLPIIFLLGFFDMQEQLKRPLLDQAFEEEVYCELTGKVTRVIRKQSGLSLYLSNNKVFLPGGKEEEYLINKMMIFCPDEQDYRVGNILTIRGEIQKFSKAINPGQFDEALYYLIERVDYKVKAEEIRITDDNYSLFHSILDKLKQRLLMVYNRLLPRTESGVLASMLLGEKYLLEEEINQLYRENGISHILAISGLHVTLIGLSVYKLLRKLKTGLIPATIFTLAFIYAYGVLTNFSVSTNRSVVMLSVMLLAKLFGKTYDMLSAISLSAFLILLQNPMHIFSVGFLLSFGAVLGIAILVPILEELYSVKLNFMSGIYVSIGAQIMTLPIILIFFYQLPAYGVLINLIILPLMSLLVLTAILAGVLGSLFLPLGVFMAGGVNYILKLYEWVCRMGAGLPGNLITVGKPDMVRILIYYFLLILFVMAFRRYKSKLSVFLLVIAALILLIPKSNAGLEVTMLDVGQGDAIFMETKTGTTYLIDGGSSNVSMVGTYRIQPFLLASGISSIDYAIVSHTDQDHVSGLKELLTGGIIKIQHLILPLIIEKGEAYEELENLTFQMGVQVSYIKAGDRIKDGMLSITCLHPPTGYNTKQEASNSYSTVLSVKYGEFDMLLTGDVSLEEESLVLDQLQRIKNNTVTNMGATLEATDETALEADYDVLKVAHHGSKNSTGEEFLKEIQPSYALISCAKENRYGHPHQELLDRLESVNSQIEITYETGAITIRTDGVRMEVTKGR